ncbi:MAG: hypothetical protein K2X93_21150 [Candidatus Obscuribacterales bacterium]|nr:hypothetical protein [Candidatus Obscuribacterales bacterium]
MRLARASMVLAVVAVTFAQMPASARVRVEDSVTVNASIDTVWKALMEYQREEKTFSKKLVGASDNTVKIKEEFMKLPVVGNAFINYDEVSHKTENRIDYKLTDSKVLSMFEGAWSLEENRRGKGVTLKLTTDIDSWMPVPFKNKILRTATMKGMERRLAFVKNFAESHCLTQ